MDRTIGNMLFIVLPASTSYFRRFTRVFPGFDRHSLLRQDIEWARDGDDGKLYIVQARPETVASQKKVGVIEEYKMLEKGRGSTATFP